jgi:hypothetical protein
MDQGKIDGAEERTVLGCEVCDNKSRMRELIGDMSRVMEELAVAKVKDGCLCLRCD